MKKYVLTVAVMQDDEPIMFIFNRVYERPIDKYQGVYSELARLFPVLDFCLWDGNDNGVDRCEYICSPDSERDDMELLAIWQKVKI